MRGGGRGGGGEGGGREGGGGGRERGGMEKERERERETNVFTVLSRTLFHAMGNCISTEARAMHNQGQAGLDFFAPNINIFR